MANLNARRVGNLDMRDPAIGRMFLPLPDEVRIPGGPRLTRDEASVLAGLHLAGPVHLGHVHDAIRSIERADKAVTRLTLCGLVTHAADGKLHLTNPEGRALGARLCELS